MASIRLSDKSATSYMIALIAVLTVSLSGCGGSGNSSSSAPASGDPTTGGTGRGTFTSNNQAKYSWIRDNIFKVRCMDCHSANQGDGDGLDYADFDTYQDTLQVVKPDDPEHSKLYVMVKTKKMPKGMDPMPGMPNPPPAVPLTDSQVQTISDWIASGAPNN